MTCLDWAKLLITDNINVLIFVPNTLDNKRTWKPNVGSEYVHECVAAVRQLAAWCFVLFSAILKGDIAS